jgi:hypothetical protein
MKKIIFIFSALAFLISTAFTGTGACDANVMFVKGTSAKNAYYKADGTLTGTGTSTVTDVVTSGDSTIATLATSYTSATPRKDEKPHDGSMRFICVNGKLIMDMGGMMNSMSPTTGHSMKMVMTGNMVPYKTSYAAGEKLNDVKMNMQMYSDKSLMMTSDISITNRVCEAVEDLTTPAGTFHCYKISSLTASVTKMGTMTMPGSGTPSKTVQWFSPKAGVVRLENFRSDTLASYNQLIELKKP